VGHICLVSTSNLDTDVLAKPSLFLQPFTVSTDEKEIASGERRSSTDLITRDNNPADLHWD